MPSTTYQAGDLLLIGFPFSGGAQVKTRPAMVVLDTGDDDVLVARVTTQHHQSPYDVPLADWQGAGLLSASTVRLHKLATLEKTLVRRMLGRLQPADRANVAAVMQQTYGQW
ncbi:MAG: type II toxin-antitoxin system PemK/MazF family toxin [Planctomycetes bacterium]|nr:type II toxin-antitoxin system PemK/MazF family toxin [Planctomycetota bacterium]